MTLARSLLLFIVAPAILSACGTGTESTQKPAAPPPVENTVAGDLVGTLDRARSVEATTMQHKEDLDHAVQEAEGH